MSAKIINLWGGPCAGKSTTALGLVYKLKCLGVNVGLVNEESLYSSKDELYTFAEQQKKLRQMVDKYDVIVTDSPLPLTIAYAKDEPMPIFRDLVMDYFNIYDNINYLIVRGHRYNSVGRMQEDEANKIAGEIERFLNESQIKYKPVLSPIAVELIFNDIWCLFNR